MIATASGESQWINRWRVNARMNAPSHDAIMVVSARSLRTIPS
jgi:hypothetical protein